MANLSTLSKNIKPYILVSKEKGIEVNSLSTLNLAERIGLADAKTADVVVIAKSDNPEQKKIITTYRDAQNQVVETVHEHIRINEPDIHRLFKPLSNYGQFNLVGRLIQVFENLDVTNRFKAWKKVSSEKQYIAKDYYKNKTHVTIAKVTTNDRKLTPTIEESHSLTQYYVPKAFYGQKIPSKSLVFETKKDSNDIPKITSLAAKNVRVPKYDKYLALRMYDADDIKKPITQIALEQNHLKGLDIPIEDSYSMEKATSGSFSHHTGVISFNYCDDSKSNIIDTAFHEATHAFQYAIMAITKRIEGTKFTQQCLKWFKGDITPELENSADIFYKAHKKYVPAEVDYDRYRKNLLEKEAWNAGSEGLHSYYMDGVELKQSFRYFPREEL